MSAVNTVVNIDQHPCACGCGILIDAMRKDGCGPKSYVHGHNPSHTTFRPGHVTWNKGIPYPRAREVHLGKVLTADELRRRTATRRAKYHGRYTDANARGWTASALTRERISQANIKRDLSGSRNPAWRGGVSFQPYPPEFNISLKRRVLIEQQHTCLDCHRSIGRRKNAAKANIHHLDGDKQNCRRSNLVALCVSCHMKREWEVNRLYRGRDRSSRVGVEGT